MSHQELSLISPPLQPDLSLPTPLKLGVMASGSGTNFEVLAEAIQARHLNAEVKVLIYNNPKAKVVERAQRYQVPCVLLDHRHHRNREAYDQIIVETLKEYGVEWVIMAGWMRIATSVFVQAFPNRMINIHPSLLPSFPGIRAVEQALAAGVKVTGCTVHLVNEQVDSGPILIQAVVPVVPGDTPESLHARIQVQEHKILIEGIKLAASV